MVADGRGSGCRVDEGLWDGSGAAAGEEGCAGQAAGGDGLGDVADLGDVFEDVGDAEGADDFHLKGGLLVGWVEREEKGQGVRTKGARSSSLGNVYIWEVLEGIQLVGGCERRTNDSWPPGFGISVMPILVTIPKLDWEKIPLDNRQPQQTSTRPEEC